MMMKNPAHPGTLIEATLEELGLSVADAATTLQRHTREKRDHAAHGLAS